MAAVSTNQSASGDQEPTGPVGAGDYVVQQGECLSSIAYRYGHIWQTIWNHPANQELRETRKDPNVLLPKDRLFIPEIANKEESCATDATHTFERKGVPVKLRLQLFREDKPRSGEEYRIEVDGHIVSEGTLDGQGGLEVPIIPNAKMARLSVGRGMNPTTFLLKLGSLDPVTEISGVQQRLRNLGFQCESSGRLDELTRSALSLFQQQNGLDASGENNDVTQSKLQEAHGC